MVILDTDHLTVIQRQSHPTFSFLSARLRRTPPADVCTTIVNVEEQMRMRKMGRESFHERFGRPREFIVDSSQSGFAILITQS
jgi:hypothetical protein